MEVSRIIRSSLSRLIGRLGTRPDSNRDGAGNPPISRQPSCSSDRPGLGGQFYRRGLTRINQSNLRRRHSALRPSGAQRLLRGYPCASGRGAKRGRLSAGNLSIRLTWSEFSFGNSHLTICPRADSRPRPVSHQLAHVGQPPGDRRRRRHRRAQQVGAAAPALPALEVAVRGRGAALARRELVGVHRRGTSSSRPAASRSPPR